MTDISVPLSPSQAKALQHEAIPAFVFEECNKLITQALSHGRAAVSLPTLMDNVFQRACALPEYAHISNKRDMPDYWFSTENIRRTYEPAGWKVTFDRPAYFESGESTFFFDERR